MGSSGAWSDPLVHVAWRMVGQQHRHAWQAGLEVAENFPVTPSLPGNVQLLSPAPFAVDIPLGCYLAGHMRAAEPMLWQHIACSSGAKKSHGIQELTYKARKLSRRDYKTP